MFDSLKPSLQKGAKAAPMPQLKIPAKAGIEGDRMVVVLVQVKWMPGSGTVSGAQAGCAKLNQHRLEVARICDYADWDGSLATTFRTAVGKDDKSFRPATRVSLTMPAGGPEALKNAKPWVTAYQQVGDAIEWMRQAVTKNRSRRYGLALVLSITELYSVVPKNTRFSPFLEAEVVGVVAAELYELVANVGQQDDLVRAGIEAEQAAQGEVDDLAGLLED